ICFNSLGINSSVFINVKISYGYSFFLKRFARPEDCMMLYLGGNHMAGVCFVSGKICVNRTLYRPVISLRAAAGKIYFLRLRTQNVGDTLSRAVQKGVYLLSTGVKT